MGIFCSRESSLCNWKRKERPSTSGIAIMIIIISIFLGGSHCSDIYPVSLDTWPAMLESGPMFFNALGGTVCVSHFLDILLSDMKPPPFGCVNYRLLPRNFLCCVFAQINEIFIRYIRDFFVFSNHENEGGFQSQGFFPSSKRGRDFFVLTIWWHTHCIGRHAMPSKLLAA